MDTTLHAAAFLPDSVMLQPDDSRILGDWSSVHDAVAAERGRFVAERGLMGGGTMQWTRQGLKPEATSGFPPRSVPDFCWAF